VVVRDAKGEREVSSESYTERPQFSADGRYIFYLVPAKGAAGHDFASGDLYRADLEKDGSEHLLPGFTMKGYALSADGRGVVFSAPDANGRTALWSADLELRSSPREFPSSTSEDEPLSDAAGHIYFRASEGGSNFLYRMNADGGDRRKVSSAPILELYSVSPDGRWAVVWQADAGNGRASYATAAIPLNGGSPLAICLDLCRALWGENGKTFAILSTTGGSQTLLTKVGPNGLPSLPSEGVNPNADLKTLKGGKLVKELIAPGPLPDQYVIIHQTVHRNLYRIPLR
jgi:Tol biopolymer transport system component